MMKKQLNPGELVKCYWSCYLQKLDATSSRTDVLLLHEDICIVIVGPDFHHNQKDFAGHAIFLTHRGIYSAHSNFFVVF